MSAANRPVCLFYSVVSDILIHPNEEQNKQKTSQKRHTRSDNDVWGMNILWWLINPIRPTKENKRLCASIIWAPIIKRAGCHPTTGLATVCHIRHLNICMLYTVVSPDHSIRIYYIYVQLCSCLQPAGYNKKKKMVFPLLIVIQTSLLIHCPICFVFLFVFFCAAFFLS